MLPIVGYILLSRLTFVYTDCTDPPQIAHSTNNLVGEAPFPEDTIVKYTCDVGFESDDYSNQFKCEGGSWNGGSFSCTEMTCSGLNPPRNGYISGNPDYSIGSYVNFACDEGYKLSGTSRLRCRLDGWLPKNSVQTCDPKDCGSFGNIQNGETFQESLDGVINDYGSEVFVSCNHGYTLSGKAKVVCEASGSWGEKPTCELSTCKDYPGLNTSCIKTSYLDDDLIFIECKDDPNEVTKTGASDFTICLNSEWAEKDLGCYCNCKCDSNMSNVIFKNCNEGGYLEHNQQLNWECDATYHKQSSKQITCYDGKMSQKPVCLVDKCLDFGDVQNGQTIPKYQNGVKNSVGSVVEVRCNEGYTITGGSPQVKCLPNLSWETQPQCVETRCPAYRGLQSHCIETTDYNKTTGTFSMVCKDDVPVTRRGPESTRCIIDQWEDETMACYCDCQPEPYSGMSGENVVAKHDKKLKYECKSCYITTSLQPIMCYDGKLTSMPECTFSFPCGVLIFLLLLLACILAPCVCFCSSKWVDKEKQELSPLQFICLYCKCGVCKGYKNDRRWFARCPCSAGARDKNTEELRAVNAPLKNSDDSAPVGV